MVETLRTRTRPSGKKPATCGGLRRTSRRLPNLDRFGRTTKCRVEKSTKPVVHGRREILPRVKPGDGVIPQNRIPVVDATGRPLMPCLAGRARRLLDGGKAVGARNKLGIFYIRLKVEKKPGNQLLVVGIDPGSKFEGFSVVGTKDTVLNLMSEAPDWVKRAVRTRKDARRDRRFRHCRRRECRVDNRMTGKSRLPPSTKSRWDAKLRIVSKLKETIPLTHAVVEDIKTMTRENGKHWNVHFSPMEIGKNYLYRGLRAIGLEVSLKGGMETKEARDKLGLKKTKSKSKPVFESHCVDAWVLARSISGANSPTTKDLYYLTPLRWHRRQLHMFEPSKGGKRRRYGGTVSLGFKRGTLFRHKRYGLCYVGGCMDEKLSLHSNVTGKRLSQKVSISEMKILTRITNRVQFIPDSESGIYTRREKL